MTDLVKRAQKVLFQNWRKVLPYLCEGLYPFQWNWDSGFIAIGWAHFDLKRPCRKYIHCLRPMEKWLLPHIVFHNESRVIFRPRSSCSFLSPNAPKIRTWITQPLFWGLYWNCFIKSAKNNTTAFHFKRSLCQGFPKSPLFLYASWPFQRRTGLYMP